MCSVLIFYFRILGRRQVRRCAYFVFVAVSVAAILLAQKNIKKYDYREAETSGRRIMKEVTSKKEETSYSV